MAHINRSALVPYSSEQMYQLVDGINLYPQFLPWCRTAVEHERDADQVKASIEIAKGAVNKRFTTLNRLQKNKTIEMRLVDGPFQHLHGFWRFDELKADACKVSLDLDFEFSNKIAEPGGWPDFQPDRQYAGGFLCRKGEKSLWQTLTPYVSKSFTPYPTSKLLWQHKYPKAQASATALPASGILERYPELTSGYAGSRHFRQTSKLDTPLRERDRIEIYRPLIADPKAVRKQRAAEGKVMKKGDGEPIGKGIPHVPVASPDTQRCVKFR